MKLAVVAAWPFPARRGIPLLVERLTAALAASGHPGELLSCHEVDDARQPPLPMTRTCQRTVRRAMPLSPRWEKLLLSALLRYQFGKGPRRGAFQLIHVPTTSRTVGWGVARLPAWARRWQRFRKALVGSVDQPQRDLDLGLWTRAFVSAGGAAGGACRPWPAAPRQGG